MFPSHYCFTINLPVIPPLWLKRGHHQFSWFAIFVWLWSWGAMGTSLWEEPGVYHLLAISCICFSTCAFQKSQHLWFASQTLDLVAATHVPTTTRSTEMIWGGIAEDTDQEFHAHEHTLHSLDLRVVSCKLLASGADSHYWVTACIAGQMRESSPVVSFAFGQRSIASFISWVCSPHWTRRI